MSQRIDASLRRARPLPFNAMAIRGSAALLAPLLANLAAGQSTVTVPGDHLTIQEAIVESSDDDTILVSPGTYDENINFLGKLLTIRSTDGPTATIIDGGGVDTVVTFENHEGANAKLIGFTITNGHGIDGSAPGRGGGVHCAQDTRPTIEDCIITGNQGSAGSPFVFAGGGGIHSQEGAPSIVRCVIENNVGGRAHDEQSSCAGAGGIHIWGGVALVVPEVIECTVRANAGGDAGDTGSHDGGAGGILVYRSPARVTGCLIADNSGGSCGSGDSDCGGPGGIEFTRDVHGATSELSYCVIRGNQGGSDGEGPGGGGAGGIAISSGAWPLISNCAIYDNSGGDTGTTGGDRGAAGGLQCAGTLGDDPVVVNCTIVNNTGGLGGMFGGGSGGIDSHISDRLQVLNCIVWGNTGVGVAPDEIGSWSGNDPRVRYSIVGQPWLGAGVINVDPLLTNIAGGDLHPTCDSPSIDAGTDFDSGIFAPLDDLDGKLRSDGLTDIGAYEYGPRPENYCIAAPNSYSQGALVGYTGSTSLSTNNFGLRADCVPNTPGMFFYGPNQIQVTFGDGFRCVGGAVKRLPPSGAMGHALTRSLNLANTIIVDGSTWNFQAWFRDPGAGGAGFNTSDAVSVTFAP